MSYSLLFSTIDSGIDTQTIRYVWDDTRVDEDFRFDADPIVQQARSLTLRARMAMGVALYEGIVFRFHRLSGDPVPVQIAEAAWCASIDARYLNYVELDRENWLGPVRGPLWCGITWLLPMLYFGDDRPEEVESGVSFLSRLLIHVVQSPLPIEHWLQATLSRLARMYPVASEDPFSDLFGDEKNERRGPLVAREAFNPQFDYRRDDATPLMREFVATVDYRQNPFLRSPEELLRTGFTGRPYSV